MRRSFCPASSVFDAQQRKPSKLLPVVPLIYTTIFSPVYTALGKGIKILELLFEFNVILLFSIIRFVLLSYSVLLKSNSIFSSTVGVTVTLTDAASPDLLSTVTVQLPSECPVTLPKPSTVITEGSLLFTVRSSLSNPYE